MANLEDKIQKEIDNLAKNAEKAKSESALKSILKQIEEKKEKLKNATEARKKIENLTNGKKGKK